MKLPNNGEDRVPIDHLLSPNEATSTRARLHLIQVLPKGVGPMEIPIQSMLLPRLKVTLHKLTRHY